MQWDDEMDRRAHIGQRRDGKRRMLAVVAAQTMFAACDADAARTAARERRFGGADASVAYGESQLLLLRLSIGFEERGDHDFAAASALRDAVFHGVFDQRLHEQR